MNILIVKIGAIGDVVMCLPLVRHIRRKHPQARITWLCGSQVEGLLGRIPEIDELVVVNEKKLVAGSLPDRIYTIFSVWNRLKGRAFDRILYYYYSPLYRILLLPVQGAKWSRFERRPSFRQNPIPGRHHSWDYIQTFEKAEGPYSFPLEYPEFQYSNPEHAVWRSGLGSRKVVAFSCGGAKNLLRDDDLRRWPIGHYRKLAEMVVSEGFDLVLTGAPTDAWVREHFEGIPYQDLIGKADLPDFVSLLKNVDVLVTHDSGPLHLADLASCPVLALFGPTIPTEKASLQSNSSWIWGGEHLHCRPCYDGRNYATCSSNECLRSVSPERVFVKLKSMLVTAEPGS